MYVVVFLEPAHCRLQAGSRRYGATCFLRLRLRPVAAVLCCMRMGAEHRDRDSILAYLLTTGRLSVPGGATAAAAAAADYRRRSGPQEAQAGRPALI